MEYIWELIFMAFLVIFFPKPTWVFPLGILLNTKELRTHPKEFEKDFIEHVSLRPSPRGPSGKAP